MSFVTGTFFLFFSWAAFAWLAIAFYTTLIATEKNLWSFWWFVGALFFGPVALIAVVGMPVRQK